MFAVDGSVVFIAAPRQGATRIEGHDRETEIVKSVPPGIFRGVVSADPEQFHGCVLLTPPHATTHRKSEVPAKISVLGGRC